MTEKLLDLSSDTKFIDHYQTRDGIPYLAKFQSYINLQKALQNIRNQSGRNLFTDIKSRQSQYTLQTACLEFDYSLQPINDLVVESLCKLALDINLQQHIDNLFAGKKINYSENRAALHTALRANKGQIINVNSKNIVPDILNTQRRTLEIAELIGQNKWFTNSHKKVRYIVNVGIGGSELGPRMATYALQEYNINNIELHFLANNDPKYLQMLFKKIDLSETVFIINSKSFTTAETITNLQYIINLLGDSLPIHEHVIAVTSKIELAKRYNIKHILPIWDWVGGRFSFCSAVNLSLAIKIGTKNYLAMLQGAKSMDEHFYQAPYCKNVPVLSALLEIWNINFLKSNSHLILSYVHFLKYLPEFLQQLEMESNGKSTNINNEALDYQTCSIIWGGLGNHAEHAYYQFLIDGSYFNTIDYFFIKEPAYEKINQTAYKKIHAMVRGLGNSENKDFKLGVNILNLQNLTPESLGAVIAMYEHKTYCQSVLWNINAFDQPGVAAVKNATAVYGL